LNERANAPNAEPEATDQAPLASRALLRELAIAGVCLLLGVLVMPCLIFAAGRTKLGPYEDGGTFWSGWRMARRPSGSSRWRPT
jgi:hypothetical protein